MSGSAVDPRRYGFRASPGCRYRSSRGGNRDLLRGFGLREGRGGEREGAGYLTRAPVELRGRLGSREDLAGDGGRDGTSRRGGAGRGVAERVGEEISARGRT